MKALRVLVLQLLPLALVAQEANKPWNFTVDAGVAFPIAATSNKKATTVNTWEPGKPDVTSPYCCDYNRAGYAQRGRYLNLSAQYQINRGFGVSLLAGSSYNERDMSAIASLYSSLLGSRVEASPVRSTYITTGIVEFISVGNFLFELTQNIGVNRQNLPTFSFHEFRRLITGIEELIVTEVPDYTIKDWVPGESSAYNKKYLTNGIIIATVKLSYIVSKSIKINAHVQYQRSTLSNSARYIRDENLIGVQELEVNHQLLNVGAGVTFRL